VSTVSSESVSVTCSVGSRLSARPVAPSGAGSAGRVAVGQVLVDGGDLVGRQCALEVLGDQLDELLADVAWRHEAGDRRLVARPQAREDLGVRDEHEREYSGTPHHGL
jgi:hypothetical protein